MVYLNFILYKLFSDVSHLVFMYCTILVAVFRYVWCYFMFYECIHVFSIFLMLYMNFFIFVHVCEFSFYFHVVFMLYECSCCFYVICMFMLYFCDMCVHIVFMLYVYSCCIYKLWMFIFYLCYMYVHVVFLW